MATNAILMGLSYTGRGERVRALDGPGTSGGM